MSFDSNPHYAAYRRCLRQLIERIDAGWDDDEAELLRDQMDFHWWHLSQEEIDSLDNLFAGEKK